jgi:hypothetical protein
LAAGCGSGSSGVAGQPAAFVQMDTLDPATIKPANLACLGSFKDPAGPTAATAIEMTVQDFEKSTPVAGATVQVFTTLAKVNANTPDVTSTPTDANGKTTVMMPAGPYRVIFRTTADPARTIETFEFNRAWNDPLRVSVSSATKNAIPNLVSVVPDDTKGVVAGDVRDCDNRPTGGLTYAVGSTGGGFESKANTFYFVDTSPEMTVPARAQKWTSGNGVFATLNVPPGDATITANGLVKEGGDLVKLSTAVAPVRANSITVVQMQPLGM